MKKLTISLSITLLACQISYAASEAQKHFYGEWDGGELGIVTIITADTIKTIWGTINIEVVQQIQKWEPVKNSNKATNASYPNGYKLVARNKDGKIANIFLWRHSKNNDRIRLQTEGGLLENGEGEGDIINRVKKSAPLKQSDYYGKWNPTNGTYVDELSVTTISSKAIKYSSIENTGEPVEFDFPILRWEFAKNTDKVSSHNFPDGYIISTESAGGYPKTIVLWRHSKNKDMILFQTEDGDLFLVRAKNNQMDKSASSSVAGVFTDKRDGKKYRIVKIGNQTWMAENLNYNASGSKCYDNKPGNCTKYGRLYDWWTAMNACPSGWHLPKKKEWDELEDFAGGENVAWRKLKAKRGWNWNDRDGKAGNGTDEFGFSALPGGFGISSGGFYGVGYNGNWYSASEYNATDAYYRSKDCYVEYAAWGNVDKGALSSVRCVKD